MAEVYSKVICDPYEWLPGYGTSGVPYHSDSGDLVLTVKYDKEIDGKIALASRTMTFKHTGYFVQGLFPGSTIISPGNTVYKSDELSVLVEFVNSEWAKKAMSVYRQVSNCKFSEFRHFSIIFADENIVFSILAQDVVVSDETLIIVR